MGQEGKAEQELLVDVGGGGGSGKGHTWDNWDDDWEKVDAQWPATCPVSLAVFWEDKMNENIIKHMMKCQVNFYGSSRRSDILNELNMSCKVYLYILFFYIHCIRWT